MAATPTTAPTPRTSTSKKLNNHPPILARFQAPLSQRGFFVSCCGLGDRRFTPSLSYLCDRTSFALASALCQLRSHRMRALPNVRPAREALNAGVVFFLLLRRILSGMQITFLTRSIRSAFWNSIAVRKIRNFQKLIIFICIFQKNVVPLHSKRFIK